MHAYLHGNGGGVGDHKLKIIRLLLLVVYFLKNKLV